MSADAIVAPPFFFAPFVSSTMRVEPAWIDYNGHLNMAYYHVLFDRATDEAFNMLGIGHEYLSTQLASYFAAECHVIYRRELHVDDPVRITMQMIDYDEKRIHFFSEMRHAREGWLSASCETMSLHVDMRTRKVAPCSGDVLANLALMRASHARLSRPSALGRVIGRLSVSTDPERVLN